MKRIVSFLLVSTLSLTMLLTGCGSNKQPDTEQGNSATSDITSEELSFPLKKKATLRFVTQSSPIAPADPNDKLIFKRLEEKTNVHIEWQNIPNTDYGEKKNLILASNDLPDAFFDAGFSDYEILKYSEDGTIVAVDELVDKYMPNLKGIYGKYPDYKAFTTAPDGHMYSYPWIEELGSGRESIHSVDDFPWINKAWLDKLGLKMPETLADLENILIQFKEKDPNGNGKKDEFPMTFVNGMGAEDMYFLYGSFGTGDNWHHMVVSNDKKVIFTANKPEWKEATKYFHEWFKKGLIDKEAFTQDYNTMKSRAANDIFGLFFTWDGENITRGTKIVNQFTLMPALTGPTGKKNVTRTNNFGLDRGRFVITKVNKNLPLTAKWVDQCYDPAQSVQNNWGTYGEGNQIFTLKDNGFLQHTDLEKINVAPVDIRQKTSVAGPLAILNEYYGKVCTLPPDAALRLKQMKEIMAPDMQAEYNYPRVFFSKEEMDMVGRISLDRSEIKQYIEKKRAEWLLKGGIDEQWDEYVAQLDKLGIKKVFDTFQKAYDRYNEVK